MTCFGLVDLTPTAVLLLDSVTASKETETCPQFLFHACVMRKIASDDDKFWWTKIGSYAF